MYYCRNDGETVGYLTKVIIDITVTNIIIDIIASKADNLNLLAVRNAGHMVPLK